MATNKTEYKLSFLGDSIVFYPQNEEYWKSKGLSWLYEDCMVLFRDIVKIADAEDIDVQNLCIFLDTAFKEKKLQKPIFLKTFAYETGLDIKGIEDATTRIVDYSGTIEHNKKKIEKLKNGEPITPISEQYLLGMLDRKEAPDNPSYNCKNLSQVLYVILLHCFENSLKIKKCSDCGKYFVLKTNSSRCIRCKADNEKQKLEEIKNTMSIKLYQKLLTHLNGRLEMKNGTENKQRFIEEYKQLKGENETFRLKELIRINDEYVHWIPSKKSTQAFMRKVFKTIEEGEKNGK